MSYKVGDRVQIRADLHRDKDWCKSGIAVFPSMEKYAGGWVTITKKVGEKLYTIAADGGEWRWHESMIQGKSEPRPREKVAEMFGCVLKEVPTNSPTTNDAVSHPSHYTDGKIEVIDFIQDKHLDFARGNVVKYIARAGKKDKSKELEDLKKARQYCDFAIRELEGKSHE